MSNPKKPVATITTEVWPTKVVTTVKHNDGRKTSQTMEHQSSGGWKGTEKADVTIERRSAIFDGCINCDDLDDAIETIESAAITLHGEMLFDEEG